MAHELFGNRFYSLRQPAWHGLGHVLDTEHTAEEAFDLIGRYDVTLEPVTVSTPGMDDIVLPHKVIVRHPTPDDAQFRTFGIVSDQYGLISPADFVKMWDESVGKPIETIGALQNGKTMFVTTKLPDFDVRGDAVENYLLAVSPMSGTDAGEVRVTPTRVVCQNTLQMSGRTASEKYTIIHDQNAKERMALWLREIYDVALLKSKAVEEALNILARTKLKKGDINTVVVASYPYKPRPSLNAPQPVVDTRMKWWEAEKKLTEQKREAAVALYMGEGTGLDTAPAKGTLWGAYNAVVETENYRPGVTDETASYSSMFGERAVTMQRAFTACMEMAASK